MIFTCWVALGCIWVALGCRPEPLDLPSALNRKAYINISFCPPSWGAAASIQKLVDCRTAFQIQFQHDLLNYSTNHMVPKLV